MTAAARTRTRAQLRGDIQFLADVVSSSARVPDANINRLIDESWQTLREIVSDNGHQLYLTPLSGTLTAGVTAPYGFGTLSLPADCVRIYAMDVTVAANDIRSLDPVDFSERNEWHNVYGAQTGIPVCFHIFNIGAESTTTVTVGTMGLMPAPDKAYAYTLWYLPSWVDRANDTDVYFGVAGWESFVVWDCVVKIAARENDMRQTYQIAVSERGAALDRILKGANSVQRAGPPTRVDAARRSAANSRSDYFRRWGT